MARENKTRFGWGWGESGKSRSVISFCFLFFIASFLAAVPSITFAQSDASISFTKKEITFFKWGNGTNEVGQKIQTKEDAEGSVKKYNKKSGQLEPTPILSDSEKSEVVRFLGPSMLCLDGNDNLYLSDPVNERIIFIPSDGSQSRFFSGLRSNNFTVDDMGNIYTNNFQPNHPGFICTHPDGSKAEFKDFDFFCVINGIAYSQRFSSAVTIYDNDDKPEKLPAHPVICKKAHDQNFDGGLIDTKRINDHLKKIGRKIAVDQVKVQYDRTKGFGIREVHFLGVDDDANIYFLYRFADLYSNVPYGKTLTEYVAIYDSNGKKMQDVPINFDAYESINYYRLVTINTKGEIYQSLELHDGVHLYKWQKN